MGMSLGVNFNNLHSETFILGGVTLHNSERTILTNTTTTGKLDIDDSYHSLNAITGSELNNIKLKHSDISCVILGGVGSYSHVKKIFENDDFEGIACGSLFSFTDSSPIRLKSYLKNNNIIA